MNKSPKVIDIIDPCYPKQRLFVEDPARYTWIEAGTKAGKTVGLLYWLFLETTKANSGEFWWVAPVYKQALIAYRRMIEFVNPELIAKSNLSELRITLVWGPTIEFKSGEKSDNLYGEDVRAAVLDECSRMREDSWFAVRSTLTATRGRAKLIGNVKGRKNWFFQGARKAEAGEFNHAYYKLTSADNPFISKEEIDDARRTLPEAVFNELYLAIPSEDQGNPFGIKAIAECVSLLSSEAPICYGVDLGKRSSWTVIIGLDEAGNVAYFDRFQKPWKETQKEIIRVVGASFACVDSTGVGDPIVEELQSACPNVEGFWFGNKSKQQIMEGLQVDIQNRVFTFPAGTIQNELESFEYEYTRTGVIYSAPDGFYDDAVCSLALSRHKYRSLNLLPRLKFKSSSTFNNGSYRSPSIPNYRG